MTRSPRGYSLPLVILLAGLIAAAFFALLTRLGSATDTANLAIKRRQAFYAADAVARAATEIASNKLLTLPGPDATVNTPALMAAFLAAQEALIQADLDTARPIITPAGYTSHRLMVGGLGERTLGQLQSGPFRGMNAQLQPFTVSVETSRNNAKTVASMSSSVVRGTLSMFQFFAFVDGYAYLYTGSGGKIAGRVHANGDICMGSNTGLYTERVTAAGSFYVARGLGCRREFDYHESERHPIIATRPLTGGIPQLTTCNLGDAAPPMCVGLWAQAGTSGTNNNQFDRDGSGHADGGGVDKAPAAWRAESLARWNGMMQDETHGVPRLRVPITGTPMVQRGRNGRHEAVPNNDNSRFLVDPMLAAEPADVRQQKLSFKSDIRILNGVWYVADPTNRTVLGTPVWSDHGGSYRRKQNEDTMTEVAASLGGAVRDVGQQDLFGAAARPRRYSYYRTAAGSHVIEPGFGLSVANQANNNQRAVISYGNVSRQTAAGVPYWIPGHTTWDAGATEWRIGASDNERELLHGTRSGFRDSWMQVASHCNHRQQRDRLLAQIGGDPLTLSSAASGGCPNGVNDDDAARAFMFNILPINFDVGAFTEALRDTGAGELGSFFPAGRPFNGIVWVGSHWPGLEAGYAATAAASTLPEWWPFQGRQNDLRQPGTEDVDTNFVAGTEGFPAGCGGARCNGSAASEYIAHSGGFYDAAEPLNTAVAAQINRPRRFVNMANQRNLAFQTALPYPLCTDDITNADRTAAAAGTDGIHPAGQVDTFGNATHTTPFWRTSCSRYLSTYVEPGTLNADNHALGARPNAVRVMNARDIDRTIFPLGLTIATNLPMYALGDHNSTSVPADTPATAVPISNAATNWRPFLLAADVVALQSSGWEDWRSQWNSRVRDSGSRNAGDTTYSFQVLAGWLESVNGDRDEVFYFTRLLENWAGRARRIRGSIVIGFASEFGLRFNWNGQSNNDDNTNKAYAYDYNLDIPENQPPGAPRFTVTATETYRRN